MRHGTLLVILSLAPSARAADVERARALDQQGVRAYQQGRYRDAIRLFREALRDGPASELWNIAKCQLKLDEPEEADATLKEYVARADVSEDDRREAERLVREIHARASSVTVLSSPSGAAVKIDGRAAGATPLTIDVAPGKHDVTVGGDEREIEASYGRAVLVDAGAPSAAPAARSKPSERRVALELGLGPSFARYGDVGGAGLPHGFVSATYALVASRALTAGVGVRFGLWGDAWSDATGATSAPPGCAAPLPTSFTAIEIAGHTLAFVGVSFAERWRASAELGLGIAGTTAGSRVGGDLYQPSCSASQAPLPALHASLEVSARVLPALRAVLRPFSFEAHPAWDGARATGAWVRFGASLGVAFDL